ncbi:hypothetical protein BBJ28_00017309 [Nothophytophthora sp. Chile5]|nr:hypothetical protein BBJ28_00017309 [Nothophytophthora sp. Chile5]
MIEWLSRTMKVPRNMMFITQPDFLSAERVSTAGVRVITACSMASTVVLDLLLILRYCCDGRVLQLQNAVPSRGAKFSLWRPLLLLMELLICSFHIPPGIGGTVEIAQMHGTLSMENDSICEPHQWGVETVRRGNACYLVYQYPVEVFGVFMILRLYLFARYVRSSSSLYSPWISLVGSLNGLDAMRPFFHFKAIFKLRPLHVLLPLTVIDTLLTAAISGTGLGDYFPVTYLGRAFSVVGGMFGGVLIVALIQSLFFNFLDLSPNEKKVRYLIETEQWEKATHRNAARLLQAAWRVGLLRHCQDLGDQRHLFALMRAARRLRAAKPTVELPFEEQVADMEAVVLTAVGRMEAQRAEVLERIQTKARRLGILKVELEKESRGAGKRALWQR